MKGLISILAGILCLTLFASQASAKELYIEVDGDGTSCTKEFPCSLDGAIPFLEKYDTLLFARGTYSFSQPTLVLPQGAGIKAEESYSKLGEMPLLNFSVESSEGTVSEVRINGSVTTTDGKIKNVVASGANTACEITNNSQISSSVCDGNQRGLHVSMQDPHSYDYDAEIDGVTALARASNGDGLVIDAEGSSDTYHVWASGSIFSGGANGHSIVINDPVTTFFAYNNLVNVEDPHNAYNSVGAEYLFRPVLNSDYSLPYGSPLIDKFYILDPDDWFSPDGDDLYGWTRDWKGLGCPRTDLKARDVGAIEFQNKHLKDCVYSKFTQKPKRVNNSSKAVFVVYSELEPGDYTCKVNSKPTRECGEHERLDYGWKTTIVIPTKQAARYKLRLTTTAEGYAKVVKLKHSWSKFGK